MSETAIASQLLYDFAEEQGGRDNPLLAPHYDSELITSFYYEGHPGEPFTGIDRDSLRFTVDIVKLTVTASGKVILPSFRGMDSSHTFSFLDKDALRAVSTCSGFFPDWVNSESRLADNLRDVYLDQSLDTYVTRARVERAPERDATYLILHLKKNLPRIRSEVFTDLHQRSFMGEYNAVGKQASPLLGYYRREFESVMLASGFIADDPSPAFTVRHELLPAEDQTATLRKINPDTIMQSWRTTSRIALYANFRMIYAGMPSSAGTGVSRQKAMEGAARNSGRVAADLLLQYFARTKFSLVDE